MMETVLLPHVFSLPHGNLQKRLAQIRGFNASGNASGRT